MIVDVPYDMGCFEELSDLSALGITVTEDTDQMSPAWCITKCISEDPNKRYACNFLKI